MVGKTVIQTWHDHVREAERLLALSQAPKGDRAKAMSHLYEAMVEITQALQKLEAAGDFWKRPGA
jgi:hypothetical protein